MRSIIRQQYQSKVNKAAALLKNCRIPPEGWLCTVRKSLSMSGAQLARRLGKSRALVSNTEKAELASGVTLKTMQTMAQAMNCRFVYAIIPEESVDAILESRAKDKATKRVLASSQHMALEQQSLSNEQIAFEIERLQREMLQKLPTDFWNDDEA